MVVRWIIEQGATDQYIARGERQSGGIFAGKSLAVCSADRQYTQSCEHLSAMHGGRHLIF
jgi:hypothetical protein